MNDTKEKISEAAKKLFAERGYDAVTTRDIAKEAGVALSALAYYFKAKENILIHLIDLHHTKQSKASFAALSDAKSIEDFCLRLEIFAETLILSLFKDLPLFQVLHSEFERRNPILARLSEDPSRDHLLKLVKFIEKAQKDGFLAKDVDAQMAALLFFKEIIIAVKFDSWKSWANKGTLSNPAYRKKWIKNLLRILFHGILPEKKTNLTSANKKREQK